jgi:hypothetical protein
LAFGPARAVWGLIVLNGHHLPARRRGWDLPLTREFAMPAGSRLRAPAAATTVALLVLAVSPLAAHAAPTSTDSSTGSQVAAAEDSLARALAASLRDRHWAGRLRSAVAGGQHDLLAVTGQAGGALAEAGRAANQAILTAKGLPASTGSVLAARLAGGSGPIAYVAPDIPDDSAGGSAALLTGYGPGVTAHRLSARTAPREAVLVIGVSEDRALQAGLSVVHAELAHRGIGTGTPQVAAPRAAGFWTTRLMSVRLNDDEEPWFKGDAEIYTIVTGVGSDGSPRADIVQMPYLDNDGTTYTPGQILVDWSHFKYNAVDAVMMEEDDGTNYRALAQAIATALLTVLNGVQYAPMVNAILAAIPDSWWTDDPDYVDSWYLLTKQSNEIRVGARNNGTATFARYFVTAV